MANDKNSKDFNSKNNIGQSSDILKNAQNGKSLNEILNNRNSSYGYGVKNKNATPTSSGPAKPNNVGGVSFGNQTGFGSSIGQKPNVPGQKPTGQAGQTPAGASPTNAGNTPPNPFANNPFFKQSTPPTTTGSGTSGQTPPPNMFGARPQTPQQQTFGQGGGQAGGQSVSQQGGQSQSTPPSSYGSAYSFLQSLKQGSSAGVGNQPQTTTPSALPTYKTKKQLKEDLKRQKQDKRLQDKFQSHTKMVGTDSGTNAFGAGPKGVIGGLSGIGAAQQNAPQAPAPDASNLQTNKTLSASDFFKQLEQLNQINVSGATNLDALSDEEYVDEKQQQILEQLERLQQGKEEKEKKKRRGAWFWIIIVVLLLLLLSIIGYIIYNNFVPKDYEYVRISVEMQNPDDLFYDIGLNGERIPVAVNPGDSFDLSIVARNSRNILGDTDAPVWKPILVRFKIWLIIDGEEMLNFVEVSPNSNAWLRYNMEEEAKYVDEYGFPIVDRDDGYYYLKGMLQPNQEILLINNIKFSLDAITEEYGGKNAELRVQVEVLEDAIGISTYWQTAPRQWIKYLQDSGYVG